MPYDAQGHWTAQVTPDPQGFVNFLAQATPSPNGQMTAAKAAPLIKKEYG